VKFYPGDTIAIEIPTSLTGTCKVQFSGPTTVPVQTAIATGTGYSLTLPSSLTTTFAPGTFFYRAFVESASSSVTVMEGEFEIKALGQKSKLRQSFEAIEAALLRQASREQLKIYVGKTQIEYMSHRELLAARGRIKSLLDAEERDEAGKSSFGTQKVYIKF